jgi:hypothetical protein
LVPCVIKPVQGNDVRPPCDRAIDPYRNPMPV